MNKKVIITIVVIAVVLLVIVVWPIKIYNRLVKADESVSTAWSQVENVYQRRADLIPQLVATVQGAADFEKSTLDAVISARAQATSVKLDPYNMTEADFQKFQAAQDNLSSSLSRLLVTVERYPELKSTKNFQTLQAQLEGTENRIAVERNKFNEVAKAYNVQIRRFPNNIVAGMFGFEKRAYFQAAPGADKAPEVKFDFNSSNSSQNSAAPAQSAN